MIGISSQLSTGRRRTAHCPQLQADIGNW